MIINTKEKIKTRLEIALTSGVMPLLVILHISIGNVVKTPFKKKVTGISSNERVKDKRADPINAVFILGKIT